MNRPESNLNILGELARADEETKVFKEERLLPKDDILELSEIKLDQSRDCVDVSVCNEPIEGEEAPMRTPIHRPLINF